MHRSEAPAQRPLIVFVKLARFSNTNAYVEEQLRLQFPEASLRVIDLKLVFQRPSWALLRGLAAALLSLARDRAAGRRPQEPLVDALLQRLWAMPVIFAAMSRAARRLIERERRPVWFTIQTQSLWNSAVPGIANFVYTDSTVLANLYFKRKDFRFLRSSAWLECERRIYTEAAKTLVMSAHVARSLTELYGIDPARVALAYVGANLRREPAMARPAPAHSKTILFVGMEWERKGGPELIAAFRRLPARHADARLLIVGAAPALDVPNCEVIGRVPAAQVTRYYEQAAIFCMPTRIEPFGIAFIEAMMHALAVAAPSHGAMLDYIRDQETGVLFEPGNCEDTARALTWLLDHPQERQAIAARGREAVRSIYTWDAVGRRMRAEILSAIGPAAPAPAAARGTFGSGPRLLPDRAG
ncbi:MAG TPA: glycosyltransferase family 4 protein [Steroidobacteraceae bacterium]|nr:glycosyltransferase family 4 protein [Steroidobacteraceae bacterium]